MGTHQGGNSGNVPPDGDQSPDDPQPTSPSPPDLPELPPEWDVTIPDDLSELGDDEVERIRQELAEERRAASGPGGDRVEPSVGLPLLIMSVAVVITLVSLFAMAWSGAGRPADPGARTDTATALPSISLANERGQPVWLTTQVPAAFLLVEECGGCGDLIAATAAAAPAGVTVVAVGGEAVPDLPPTLATGAVEPLLLADPDGLLRAGLGLDPPSGSPAGSATVVLVDRDQQVVRTLPIARTVSQFQADLAALAD